MKRFSIFSLTAIPFVLLLLLTSCQSSKVVPSTVGHQNVAVEGAASGRVRVAGPTLKVEDGKLTLSGSISKKPGASTTAFSHLDVTFLDRAGTALAVQRIPFSPRNVGHLSFATQRGYYSLPIDVLPAGTVRVEVRAHDDEH